MHGRLWVFCWITLEGELMPLGASCLVKLTCRCFLYLFPALQTWYLVLVLIAFM